MITRKFATVILASILLSFGCVQEKIGQPKETALDKYSEALNTFLAELAREIFKFNRRGF